ncbi:MAG: divalent metal cation transporter [Bryobacterales bacterium]
MNSSNRSALSKLGAFFASIVPGIFMVGYVIGTGSVTTMATAGASYGMSLTWTLMLASFLTHVMFVGISKCTIVSGDTILFTFRKHFGRAVTLFIMFGLVLTQIASIIGVMAIVTDVVREWSRPLTADGAGFSQLVLAILFTSLLLALFWNGRHQFFLKVLSLLVALMGIAFVVTASMVAPEPGEMLRGIIPSIPAKGNPQLLIAGMIGTTMASVVLFSRSVVVKEKGWTPADLPTASRDSMISVTLMFVINSAIMACAAGTLFVQGLEIENAIDMVSTLEPLAGRLAVSGFVIGIIAAGLSSLFPNYLLGPWMICDFLGLPRDLSRRGFRILVVVTALFGLVVPVFGGRPVQIMIASQAISPLIMPLIASFTMILLLKKSFVGEHSNSTPYNVALGITVLFTFYMLYLAVLGFLGAIG